ncbi:MAG TPA: fibronectin type III domain-containing protein, partial [Bacteroidales bacterium]|nr:fibronectin type III domain-containing protein [Bacteroidales bacterium]
MPKAIISFLILWSISLPLYSQINSYPYNEGFDVASIPSEWTQEFVSGAVLWSIGSGGYGGYPSAPYSGSGNALFSSPNYNSDETMLISPEFDLSAVQNPRLRFYHAQYNWDTDQDVMSVYYRQGESGEWILISSYNTAVTAWTLRVIELPEPSSSYFIGFKATSGYGFGVVLDDVVVDDAPQCNTPSEFSVLSTSTESANFNWTSEANLWQLEYGPVGFSHGGGILVENITSAPFTLFGLTEGQSYQAYVRAVCSGNNSEWAGPVSFTADCNLINANNFIEGFESSSAPPACWSVVYQNTTPPAGNLVTHTTTYAFSGNRSFRFSSYSPGPPYGQYLITPEIGSYTGTRELRFWYKRYSSGSETFRVGYSTTGTNLTTDFNWTEEITDATAQWKLYNMVLPPNVKFVAINYRTVFQYYLYLDQFQIRIPPTCPQPENLHVSNITAVSAHINWLAGSNEESWQVEYGFSGFSHGEGTITNTSFPVHILQNLSPNSNYDVYVRALCDEENSTWVGPLSFSTPYGCQQITNISISNVSATSAFIDWVPSGSEESWNMEYGISGFTPGTGTIISGITESQYSLTDLLPNTTYDVRIQAYCGNVYGVSLWSNFSTFLTLPCNDGCNYTLQQSDAWGDGWGETYISVLQNGIETNKVYMTSGSFQSADIYLCNEASVSLVIHPSSFVSEVGLNLLDAFGNSIYQLPISTLEEGISVTTLVTFFASCTEPECYPPINPAITSIHAEGAVVSWEASASIGNYQVSYGFSGFNTNEGYLSEDLTETNYTISGLFPQTTYEVYIRTLCTSGNSIWSGPYSFTTTSMNLSNPIACNAALNIPDNSCVSYSISVNDPENETLGMDVLIDEIRLIMTHNFDGDIDLSLSSPDGTTVLLFSDVGGSGDNFGNNNGSCNQYTSLAMDGASGAITSGTAPFIGSFIPEGNINAFHNGGNINGDWTLQICDDNAAFTGTLQYFEIVFTEQKYLEWSSLQFVESPENNGSISNSVNLGLYNETFAVSGPLNEGAHYLTSNIPSGLTAHVEVVSPNSALLTLTGYALNHSNASDINNISIEFLNAAFSGGQASEIVNYKQLSLSIDFKNLTDIANLTSSEDEYVCETELNNYFVQYMFVNTGENIIPAGTTFQMRVEDASGNILLSENIILSNNLDLGEDLGGISVNSIHFADIGLHSVKIIVKAPSDILPINDTIVKNIVGVEQNIVFWFAENDSLNVTEYPAIVAAWMDFNPDSSLNYTYYWENGISTSNSIDVIADGWYHCTITSEACPITD